MRPQTISRRRFLSSSAAVLGAPMFIPASALGRDGRAAPSERITLATIGWGMMGPSNTRAFLQQDDCQVVGICDVDRNHLEAGVKVVNEHYKNEDCAAYHDFRELLGRSDLDAVCIALPDHWHAPVSIAAARAGKDIYGEKPLSHTFVEGQKMVAAVQRFGRIWQTGSWQRSKSEFRQGCEIVRSGLIGKVHTVEVGLPEGHTDFYKAAGQEEMTAPPEHLDYERWLGPAPWAPYCLARVHRSWRWHLDYGGGQLMDWVGHHVDIAHWGLDCDHTGPYEIEGRGEWPTDGLWNTATKFHLTAKYPNDVTMIIAGGYPEIGRGTKFIGEHGWVYVNRGTIETYPRKLARAKLGPNDVRLYESPGHQRNFLDCVRSRRPTLTPAEVAHRSATPGHLGQIAMLLGRKIRWNAETEQILDDATATRMLDAPRREPWNI